MFRNGRFQAASTDRSARCRSDQIQVRSGGLLMIGIGAFCISVARRASSDVWLVPGLSSASSASHRSRTASALAAFAVACSVNSNASLPARTACGALSSCLLVIAIPVSRYASVYYLVLPCLRVELDWSRWRGRPGRFSDARSVSSVGCCATGGRRGCRVRVHDGPPSG